MPIEPRIDGWTQILTKISSPAGKHLLTHSVSTATKPTPSECAAMAANWYSAVGPKIRLAMTSVYNLDSVLVRTRWKGSPQYEGEFFPTQPQGGTLAGDSTPSSASICVGLKSLARGRSAHGRSYMLGLSEGSTSLNTVDTNYMTLLLNYAAAILAFTNPGSIFTRLAVASVKLDVMIPYASFLFDNQVDNQRRRLSGRGG